MSEHDEWLDEQSERREMLRAAPTTWHPAPKDTVRDIAEGGITRPMPTLWERGDGKFLVYPKRTHLFMGETGSMKTWEALVVCAQEIRKGNAALFIDLEDDIITAVDRLKALGLLTDEIVDGFLYYQPSGAFDEVAGEHIDVILGTWSERTATVAVIDSMTEAMMLHGLDPDKGTNVSEFYAGLPRYLTTRHELGVIMIDHVTKAKKGRGRWAIGSERKVSGLTGAAYGFELVTEFGDGMTGKVRVLLSKDRAGSVRPLTGKDDKVLGTITFVSDADTGAVTTTFETPRTVGVAEAARTDSDILRRIIVETAQVIESTPGIGSTDLRDALDGDNGKKTEAVEWLVEHGHLDQHKVGRKMTHTLLNPLPDPLILSTPPVLP